MMAHLSGISIISPSHQQQQQQQTSPPPKKKTLSVGPPLTNLSGSTHVEDKEPGVDDVNTKGIVHRVCLMTESFNALHAG